jgi:NarL family two-component system sensor histidine kinase YdfH
MKYLRRVHPLCWILLVLFSLFLYFLYYLLLENAISTVVAVFAGTLLLFHLCLYWVMLYVELKKGWYWLSIFIQLGLILTLAQILSLLPVNLVLLPLLLIVVTMMLQRARISLIALGGYLALMLQQEQRSHERTRDLLQQLHVAHAQLSSYALRIEELTTITERQRIARDLHDTLVQGVAGLLMQVDVIHTHVQHGRIERAQELLEQVMDDARNTVSDARCAIGELRTESVRPDDLIEMIQEEVSRFSATTGITCVSTLDELARTPASCCEHVLRTIMEGLTNIARHAHAQHAWIHVSRRDDVLLIGVHDDGSGFDAASTSLQIGHYGLLGMRERAKLIGGQVEVKSEPGIGTTLLLQIPLHVEQNREGEARCSELYESSLSMTI